MNTNTILLPVAASAAGREFLVDVENREFRDFNNPRTVIKMHSSLGRQLVKEMQGTEWNSWGISTGRQKGLEV